MSAAKEIHLAEPRGFCAGVDRAIEIVERALATCGRPLYVHDRKVRDASGRLTKMLDPSMLGGH